MNTASIVLLTIGALALVVLGIVVSAAMRRAECRDERVTAAAEAAQRQHQLALVQDAGVEELTQSGSYLHVKRAVPVPQGAGLPLGQVAAGGPPAAGQQTNITSSRHSRPGGVTEWTAGAAATPAAPTPTPPPAPPVGGITIGQILLRAAALSPKEISGSGTPTPAPSAPRTVRIEPTAPDQEAAAEAATS